MACADEKREKLCVFAVNLRREPVTLNLDLTELGDSWIPLAAEAVCDTRDMRQPDVMNHEIGAERVRTVALKPRRKDDHAARHSRRVHWSGVAANRHVPRWNSCCLSITRGSDYGELGSE